MSGFSLFQKYLNFEFVDANQLNLITDYICANLNSGFNYAYWYDMYCYTTKSKIVVRFKQEKNELAVTQLGQCVCKNEVINFLKNRNKNKCNCEDGCASVYFNVVF